MPLVDPLTLLTRADKWYLGNASLLLYAPPFPEHLDTPGFWDECHFGDLKLPRLLCVSFAMEVKASPAELEPRLVSWQWHPDRIEAQYQLGIARGPGGFTPAGITLAETRQLGPDGTLHCNLELSSRTHAQRSSPPLAIHVIAWTVRDNRSDGPSGAFRALSGGAGLSYEQEVRRRAHSRGDEPLRLEVTLTGSRKPVSLQATPSHSAALTPRLAHTPLWDTLKDGKLTNAVVGDTVLGSLVYAGLHWRARLGGATPYRLALEVAVRDPRLGSRPVPGRSGSRPTAGTPGHSAGRPPDPSAAWREFIALVPHFECSNEMLTRYYWYRWYGLRLNAVPPGGNYAAPAVCEGIGYFRGVITYSLMCHLAECKWLADPALARGCLQNHLAYQTRSGQLPGHIYLSHVNTKGFYHTDLGRTLTELLSHHPDAALEAELRAPLMRLLAYYQRERDREGLSLYDVWNQYETGQELSSRYFHADGHADLYGWEHKLKLKGVDVTCYVYHLAQLLCQLAARAGDASVVRDMTEAAERIKTAVRTILWEPLQHFFVDYNVSTKRRSPYLAAIGFWPLLSDLADDEQALAAAEHLSDPKLFAAPWPTPTVTRDDPHFSADPRWRGERANCPWNGRVWPMVNSHLAEVLARLAQLNPAYRRQLAAYLLRFIEMMHFEDYTGRKDLHRPNCFEHYHPLDGSACEYRGIDDYQHSWVADLILKYVAGVRIEDGRLVVDPFPFKLKHLLLKDCRLAGHRLDICLGRDRRGRAAPGYRVYLDGKLAFRAKKPQRWELPL